VDPKSAKSEDPKSDGLAAGSAISGTGSEAWTGSTEMGGSPKAAKVCGGCWKGLVTVGARPEIEQEIAFALGLINALHSNM
jgi:hypothetical protein